MWVTTGENEVVKSYIRSNEEIKLKQKKRVLGKSNKLIDIWAAREYRRHGIL